MTQYLISVDIGTQGTKAGLFDTDLRPVATAFEPSRLIQPQPGTVWQEADDLYGSVTRTVARLMESSGAPPDSVLCVGVDSQMSGIMGIGGDGEAVTYYDSWLDTRCKDYVDVMRERAGGRMIEITGGPVSYNHGPKILWWKEEQPDAYKRIAKFVLPHGYVVGKICGNTAENACFDYTGLQYSGFGDNKNKVWSDELLSVFGVGRDKMARIASPFEVIGKTSPDFAKLTGLAAGIPVVAGAGDTASSIFGAGLFERDRILDVAGSASVLCSVAEDFVPDTRFQTMTMMRSPEEGKWFPLAYINGGGLCLRWFRDRFTGTPHLSYAELEKGAGQIPPGSEGITFIPHFAGRVLPSSPSLKGSFVGLDWKHTKEHLFRAVMEGVAYEYHYYLEVLRALYPKSRFERMAALGGGAKSELFLSIKADVLGVDVTSYETGDTALIGSAVIAGVGAGVFRDYQAVITGSIRENAIVHRDESRHRQYQPLARRYLQVLDALTKLG